MPSVTLDAAGTALAHDVALTLAPSALGAALGVVGEAIVALNFTTTTLGELDLQPGLVCGEGGDNPLSWPTLFESLGTTLAADKTIASVSQLTASARAFITAQECFASSSSSSSRGGGGGAAVVVNFYATSGSDVTGVVTVSTLRSTSIVANYTTLSSTATVARLAVPLLITTNVSFSLATGGTVEAFTVRGHARTGGFAMAVIENMQWAGVSTGTLDVSLDLPNSARLNLTATTLSDFGTTGTVTATDDLSTGFGGSRRLVRGGAAGSPADLGIAVTDLPTLFARRKDVQASTDAYATDPRQVLTMLRYGALELLPMLLLRGLNVALPVSGEPLGDHLQAYANASASLVAALQFAGVPTTNVPVAATQSLLCPSAIPTTAVPFSVTVNGAAASSPSNCTLAAGVRGDLVTVAAQLAAAVDACGYEGYFDVVATVSSAADGDDDFDEECGSLALYPTAAGLVRSMDMNATALGINNAAFTLAGLPAFGTWHDLNQMLAVFAQRQQQQQQQQQRVWQRSVCESLRAAPLPQHGQRGRVVGGVWSC